MARNASSLTGFSSMPIRCKPYSAAFDSILVRWDAGAPPPTSDGGGGGSHERAQLRECVRLDLSDALGRDAVFVGELVEGGLVLAYPALLEDVAAPLVEASECLVQAVRGIILPFLRLDAFGGVGRRRRQECGGAEGRLLLVRIGCRVEGQVARSEPLL